MFPLEFDAPVQLNSNSTSVWVHMFRWLGLGVKFPLPEAPESELDHFKTAVALAPLIMFVLGLIVSLTTLIGLCCCRRSSRAIRRPEKPSSVPLLCFAVFVFAFIGASSVACFASGNSSYSAAVNELDRAASDLNTAVKTGENLNVTGAIVLASLDTLHQKCPTVWNYPQVNSQLVNLQEQVQTYKTQISDFTATVKPIANDTSQVQDHHEAIGDLLLAVLAIPMVLVTITCVCIVSAVVAVRCCGGSDLSRCCDICCLRLGGSCISFAVLLAVVVASAQLALGITASSFCENADGTVLGYAKHSLGANSIEYKTAKYYITERGDNPIMEKLVEAQSYVKQANASFVPIEQLWPTISKAAGCQDWSPDVVKKGLTTIDTEIAKCKTLVDVKNIYPYYDEIVHNDACGAVISSLGWLVVFQLVGGVFLLPVMASISGSFFTRWSAWKLHSEGDMGSPAALIENRAF